MAYRGPGFDANFFCNRGRERLRTRGFSTINGRAGGGMPLRRRISLRYGGLDSEFAFAVIRGAATRPPDVNRLPARIAANS